MTNLPTNLQVAAVIPSPRCQWEDVAGVIPWHYKWDGASSPFRWFYPFLYSRTTQADIDLVSRVHDFGYGPARLYGSPLGLSKLTKADWDAIYRDGLIDRGHPRIAWAHHFALDRFGGPAWRRCAEYMEARGWHCYDDFLASLH
jgi:hypothetical protein